VRRLQKRLEFTLDGWETGSMNKVHPPSHSWLRVPPAASRTSSREVVKGPGLRGNLPVGFGLDHEIF
jgi:hypothetical protein